MKACVHAQLHLTLSTPRTAARQAPLPMGFPRQEYWNGLPLSSPGTIPNPGIGGRGVGWVILYHWATCDALRVVRNMLDGWLAFAQAENSEGLCVHQRREAAGKVGGDRAENPQSEESWPNFCPNSYFSPPLLYLRPNSQSKDKGRHENKRFQLQLLVSEGHLLLGVQRVLLMFCRSRDLVNSAGFIFITKYTCIKKIHMHEIHHLHHHSHPPVTAIFNS